MAIQDTVREKLQSQIVKDLIAKKDSATLRAVYAKLLEMDPGNKEVLAAMEGLKKMEAQAEQTKKAEYFKKADETILNFIKQENLVNAEQAALEMLSYYPENTHYQEMLKKIQALQEEAYEKGLKAYFQKATPALIEEYKAKKKDFVAI